MNGFVPELDSEYIIDGARMELTPRQILEEATGKKGDAAETIGCTGKQEPWQRPEPIVDESMDPAPDSSAFSSGKIDTYLKQISASSRKARNIPAFCPEEITRAEIAGALTETIWKTGHFRLDDLIIDITWEWATATIGNMAAFYKSVEAACSYLDLLGIRLGRYGFTDITKDRGKDNAERKDRGCRIKISVSAESSGAPQDEEDEPVDIAETIDRDIMNTPDMNPALPQYEMPFRTANPVLGKSRKCPSHVSSDSSDWLIYIPFDTCKFRLGGSLLAEKSGQAGGKAPDVMDSDYFIDCFEVVREFVEDGIIVSGAEAGPGGLICALDRMASATPSKTGKSSGIDADISGISRSYGEDDTVRILFGEVPGVVVEIRDSDFDYVDAEMLLQDVAYYPVGHPGKTGLRIASGSQEGVAGILQALLGQEDIVPEGED